MRWTKRIVQFVYLCLRLATFGYFYCDKKKNRTPFKKFQHFAVHQNRKWKVRQTKNPSLLIQRLRKIDFSATTTNVRSITLFWDQLPSLMFCKMEIRLDHKWIISSFSGHIKYINFSRIDFSPHFHPQQPKKRGWWEENERVWFELVVGWWKHINESKLTLHSKTGHCARITK